MSASCCKTRNKVTEYASKSLDWEKLDFEPHRHLEVYPFAKQVGASPIVQACTSGSKGIELLEGID